MIKAVLFDMYRTLGEASDFHDFRDLLASYGLDHEVADRITRVADSDAFDGAEHYEFSADELTYKKWCAGRLHDALSETHLDPALVDEIMVKREAWTPGFVDALQVFPETDQVLQQLHDAGFVVAVCSNWDWNIDVALESLGLTAHFDNVFSSAQLGVRKPHEAFYHRILQRLSLNVDEVMFVGDTWETDIVGAIRIGMRAVWVDRWQRTQPEQHELVTRGESLLDVLDVARASL